MKYPQHNESPPPLIEGLGTCEQEWSKTCNQSFLLSQEYQAYIGAEKEKGRHYMEPLKHQENDEEHQILHRELYS
jgi:hypothetical protein